VKTDGPAGGKKMETPKNLDELEALLKKVTSAKDLFGTDPNKVYRALAMLAHPDRNPGDDRASKLYAKVLTLFASLSALAATVRSKKRVYTLERILAVGDVADVHLATAHRAEDDTEGRYLLKISRVPGGQALLDNEQQALSGLHTAAGDTTYRKYLPLLVESFPAKDKIDKRVNVFAADLGGYYTAGELRDRMPGGVGGRHVAWMYKRLLTVLGFAHRHGRVHAAVLPPHVRIQAESHGAQLTSWGHSVEAGKAAKTISSKYKDWYPPEVLKKEPATSCTDVYMAARLMLYLAGVDLADRRDREDLLPVAMQRFFQSCLLPAASARPHDAWALSEEFDDLLKGLYGRPRFVKLQVPA
jgi:hypothetical protein